MGFHNSKIRITVCPKDSIQFPDLKVYSPMSLHLSCSQSQRESNKHDLGCIYVTGTLNQTKCFIELPVHVLRKMFAVENYPRLQNNLYRR